MPRLSKIGAAALAAFGWTSGSSVTATYLVVAGGGGGGKRIAGGGGAGGYRTGTLSLNPTLTYTVTVGAGGAGSGVYTSAGTSGSDSVFSTVTSTGGGGGAGSGIKNGVSGGSGGGSSDQGTVGSGNTPSTSPSQGNNGGTGSGTASAYGGGGGGGASAVGGDGTSSVAGNGGAGTANSISGSSVTYAGGGGGGSNGGTAGTGGSGGGGAGTTSDSTATAGTANTGGGGGGCGGLSTSSGTTFGGQGGSGVVIISYTAPQKFSGGVVTTSGGNVIHTFTTSGTLGPITTLSASYLIVAGGGAGGGTTSAQQYSGGGGGAGGLLSGSGLTIDPNSTYLVTVGAGGAGTTAAPTAGSNSAFSMVATAAVAGGGGGYNAGAGSAGGSGGGGAGNLGPYAGGAGTVGQGNNGGQGGYNSIGSYGGGGGGGSGAVGSAASASGGGNGGAGSASSISGTSTYYAGGGGGGSYGGSAGTGGTGGGGAGGLNANGTSGTANTGGGGGGCGENSTYSGGNGGSGVVIISYPGSTQQMAGGTVTIVGGNVIHTFTSTGYLAPLKYVNNSLRFRSSASAYMNRTFTTPTSSTKWTWSAWVKRGTLGASQTLFSGQVDVNNWGYVGFLSGDTLTFSQADSGSVTSTVTTTQVFRDPAAWYHIAVAFDSTQATAANRLLMYINGVQVTSFGTASYLSQNTASRINAAVAHQLGRYISAANYLDGYMAEVNFIDGQALTPNSFGTFNSYGVWQPITYGGSYGTNGFYLPFNPQTSGYVGTFNGSNQYLTVPDSSIWAFSGSFTLEAYFYVTTTSPALQTIIAQWVDSGGTDRATQFGVNSSAQLVGYGQYGANQYGVTSASGAVKINTWYHAALVVNGSTMTLYLNGVAQASTTVTGSLNNSTAPLGIGGYGNGSWPLAGAISNARVTNTAVYTSNFTPSTSALTAVTGTQLLTLQNASIVDNSTNAFTITNVNTVTTGQTYPFAYGIFNDKSPAGNNWTPNNISGAVGTTLDYMTDVPTLTSATAANFCVLNPLDKYTNVTVSNGNLSATFGAYTGFIRSTFALPSTGKWYWEGTVPTSDVRAEFGIATFSQALGVDPQTASGCWFLYSNGTTTLKYNAGTGTSWGTAWVSGDIIGIAFDADAGTLTYYKNGTLQGGGAAATGLTGTYSPMVGFGNNTSTAISVNFGQQPFAQTPPSGHIALNTYNL